jgi:hypothetical protein
VTRESGLCQWLGWVETMIQSCTAHGLSVKSFVLMGRKRNCFEKKSSIGMQPLKINQYIILKETEVKNKTLEKDKSTKVWFF